MYAQQPVSAHRPPDNLKPETLFSLLFLVLLFDLFGRLSLIERTITTVDVERYRIPVSKCSSIIVRPLAPTETCLVCALGEMMGASRPGITM
jgi:hypothetical protein